MTFGVLVLVAATAFASDSGRNDSYVFRDGGVTWMLGEGMSPDALKQIQSRYGDTFLWARRNGQTFVTHESLVMDEARLVVARRESRERQQERLAQITDAAIRRTSKPRGAYLLASDITRALVSQGMTIKSIMSLRNKYPKPFLWVQTPDGTWLIDNRDYLDRATSFFADEAALGPAQHAVGEEEAKLDLEEERLEKMHESAVRNARLEEINRRQEEASRREQELDERQEALEKIAEDQLWALIDDAIRRGVARPLR